MRAQDQFYSKGVFMRLQQDNFNDKLIVGIQFNKKKICFNYKSNYYDATRI